VLPQGGDVVAGGKILDHLDVRDQTSAGKGSLEQIMAEHGVVRHPPRQRPGKGIDIIDALAGVRSLVEQVLIDIRNCRRIGIDPGVTGMIR
jgi:hypothetical protein